MLGYFNEQLFEGADLVAAFKPVDLSVGANVGAWLSMRDYHRACVILARAGAAGQSADQSTLTISQATSSAGAGSTALNTTRQRYKTDMTQAAGDTWTIADVTTPTNQWLTPAGYGENETLLAIDIEGQDLNDAGGFHWIQASVNQAAHACIGWCFVLFYSGRHDQRVPVSCLSGN